VVLQSALVESRAVFECVEWVVLGEVLGEQGYGEVELAATGAPDEALVDERFAVHGRSALVFDAEAVGDVG
jgi:hypothetical protein